MMTDADKKQFLETFCEFLDTFQGIEYGKVYFRLTDDGDWQGWIVSIGESTFEYFDSGPLSREEPYFLNIADIDPRNFSYWDEEVKIWTDYFGTDKFENRRKTDLRKAASGK